MVNTYAYDNLLVLKRVLNIAVKNLKKDIHTPENSVKGEVIERK